MSHSRYPHLLAPGRIGSMPLRNRTVVTAMGVNLAEADGTCGERFIAYHAAQARGGVGMIITGATAIAWPVGAVIPNQSAISDDCFIPSIRALADAVHAHGARLAIQLQHGGLNAVEDTLHGRPLWTPSEPRPAASDAGSFFLPDELRVLAASGRGAPSYKELTEADIREVVAQFASAARRARDAGVDAVEVHAGHGYLLSSFLSPYKNRRDDAYGGALENRARFTLEVIRAIRAEVGDSLAILCKLDAREEGVAGGITLENAIATARLVEAAGADAITVTAYHDTNRGILHSASHTPQTPALNLPSAAAIRAAVGIPVIASGRVEPEVAEAAMAAGGLDFLSMGRKLLADPELPKKLAEGREADIRPCVYCYTCISAIYLRQSTRCAVNPEIGHEHEVLRWADDAGSRPHVAVVGGGPGGMEAARRLRLLGHRVTLLEQEDRLGGTLRFAALAYEPNERLLAWLARQVEALGVEVRLKTRATPELLRSLGVETVIVASGARRALPPIPGAEQDHVFSGDDMRGLLLGQGGAGMRRRLGAVRARLVRLGVALGISGRLGLLRNASRWWMPFGRRIVVIGGELVGLELAEFLHERGRHVTVVDDAPVMGAGLTYVRRARVVTELREHGVGLFPAARDIRIEGRVVHFIDAKGEAQQAQADQVIVAKGASGDTALADTLRTAGFRVMAIGDCTGVGYIEGAMRGAADAVRALGNL